MLNNKVKRNIWLTLGIFSIIANIDRAIRVADGTCEWTSLASTIVITAFCIRFYLCYRRQVKAGNLNGKVNPLN